MRTDKELLEFAGKLASAARIITGGKDISTGATLPPVNAPRLSEAVAALRHAVDAYDAAILEQLQGGSA